VLAVAVVAEIITAAQMQVQVGQAAAVQVQKIVLVQQGLLIQAAEPAAAVEIQLELVALVVQD
jgi:hypothetical protein|tara:strand:- start:240 stop:428 length:189 start_codon:yes stop_codon:yes gene_type:complete